MKKYTEIEFPKTRIATLDVGELGRKKHHVKGLVELDVTETRQLIREYRLQTLKPLSFTAWLIKTISTTLKEFPQTHAYLQGKRKAMVFTDIDIAITVEREYEGTLVPLPYVIRQSNTKNFSEITQEIDQAKNKPITKDDIVLGQRNNALATNVYYALPGFLRRVIWKYLLLRTKVAKKNMGSAVITAVGMMGNISGWFIQTSVHPISFGISSITKKPGVVKNRIEIREFLHMTVLLDHDVVDGAPMARFIKKLSENIESGFGLTVDKK